MLSGVDDHRIVGYLLAQLAATVLIYVSMLVIDASLASSSLAGGLIATVATGWFAAKVFAGRRKPGLEYGPVVVRQFYWGELNKILLTAALFVIAFIYIRPVSAAALLGAYFVVHITPSLYELIAGRGRNVDTRNNNE
jgi:ATP synthase protein I